MQWWSVLALILCAMILISPADAVGVSSPLDPDPEPVGQGAMNLLRNRMNQEDSILKEQLKKSITNLKKMLKAEDTHLDERISNGFDRLKEQLKEGDNQLKEDLDEDVTRLRERLTKGLSYLKDELEEGDVKTNEELTKLKEEVFGKRPCGVKQSDGAVMDNLRQQMIDIQAELKTHQETLQCTQADLETIRAELHTTRADLHTTLVDLQTTQADLNATRADLETTRADLEADLQTTEADLNTTRADLQTTQADLQTTQQKAKSNEEALQETRQQLHEKQQTFTTLKAQLQTTEQAIISLKVEMDSVKSNYDLVSSEMGSTFTRWGRTTCPDNTSLVYSGYVGGQYFSHTGGGSNYLCLVKDPQLDNMTFPKHYNKLYGAEYEHIEGQQEQDALCSVCRAPQVTTLMIPATLSCPPGWTTQYRGHLVTEYHAHRGRKQFVCLDEIREYRDYGQGEAQGANLFLIVSQCDSLPCPPYAKKVVTCVVCST